MNTFNKTILALTIASMPLTSFASGSPFVNANSQRLDIHTKLITSNTHQAYVNTQAIANQQKQLNDNELATNAQAGAIMKNSRDIASNSHTANANAHVLTSHQKLLDENDRVDTAQANGIVTNTNAIAQNHAAIVQSAARAQSDTTHMNENTQHAFQNHVDNEKTNALLKTDETHINENTQHAFQNHVDNEMTSARIQTDEKKITQNSDLIATQESSIRSSSNQSLHAESMAAHAEAGVTQNAKNIQKNTADIQSLRQDFEDMAKNIDGAYAESAAFAGLVNPYGVGNMAVTASVGYHGDAQALAVGLGERFSENLTGKIGGAFDTATESMSAYAGVGYEF